MIELRKKFMISVIIPAHNEQDNIENVINSVKKRNEVDEIIVIDDGSIDATVSIAKRCGVKVISTRENRGKGYAMKLGASRATGDILLFLDADFKNIDPKKVGSLIEPFRDMCDFVKTRFDRKGGRVTLLTAKPLLEHFFPEIAQRFEQPLSGQIGIKKDLLEKMTIEYDYGVDVGILIDAVELGAKTEEIHLGYLEHDERELETLDVTAKQVTRVILDRAAKYKRLERGTDIVNSQYA